MTDIIRRLIRPGLFKGLSAAARDHLRYCLWDGYSAYSYAQEGEDVLLNRILDSKKRGFYIDVGAHHPKRFSNTYFFYRRGWRGINIDAMPGSMRAFNAERPGDINLETGVGVSASELTFFTFADGALNTFDAKLAATREDAGPSRTVPVPVRGLEEILDEHLPARVAIDFLSVDVEGLDLDVLRSNHWQKYRPRIVLVEVFGNSMEATLRHPTSIFLAEQGYEMIAKTLNTAFFQSLV